MADSKFIASVTIILVFISMNVTAFDDDHDHDLAPALAPLYEKICEDVECGKGKCVANISYPLGFKCECEPGWRRTNHHDDDDDDHDEDHHIGFLPCAIPNCTMDYSCQPAPPPVPEKEVPLNRSLFDPCYWAYCGEGSCTKENKHKHTCQCKQGFYNLMNVSFFPCYSDCTIGSDCSRLGIRVSDAKSDNGTSGNDIGNQATSFVPGKFHWMAIFMATALAFWR